MAERNPNLISPKAMEAMASTAGAGRELISEIFPKINKAAAGVMPSIRIA